MLFLPVCGFFHVWRTERTLATRQAAAAAAADAVCVAGAMRAALAISGGDRERETMQLKPSAAELAHCRQADSPSTASWSSLVYNPPNDATASRAQPLSQG